MAAPTYSLAKYPEESRVFEYDFAEYQELINLDTLSSVGTPVSYPSGLTFGTPLIDGTFVKIVVSAGTVLTTYFSFFTVTLASGRTIAGGGRINVLDHH